MLRFCFVMSAHNQSFQNPSIAEDTKIQQDRPWYREPWPWILFGIPLATLVAGIVMYFIALRTNDGLVVGDYYKQGLAINRTLARDDLARAMGLSATVQITRTHIVVDLKAHDGVRLPEQILFSLAHATQPQLDMRVMLQGAAGKFQGELPSVPNNGRWHMVLEDQHLQWRIARPVQVVGAQSGVEF